MEIECYINAKANEQDTASYEKEGKRSASGIKLTSSEKAEPNSPGNIAEEANGKDSKPDNTYTLSPSICHEHVIKSRAEYKHFVHGDSDTQKGMQSDEGSSVDPSTQNINRKVFFNILHQLKKINFIKLSYRTPIDININLIITGQWRNRHESNT